MRRQFYSAIHLIHFLESCIDLNDWLDFNFIFIFSFIFIFYYCICVCGTLSKCARFFLGLVVVCRDNFVVQHEVVVLFVNFGQNVRQRFANHIHDLLTLKQLAILLNGEIAVKFVQRVLRIGRGFDADIYFPVHGVQHLTPFKLDRRVNPFIHQIRQRTLRAAKTGVHYVPPIV